jgi:hypothetical protein
MTLLSNFALTGWLFTHYAWKSVNFNHGTWQAHQFVAPALPICTLPEKSDGDPDGCRRARGDAGAAAGASIGIDGWQRRTADARREANGAYVAEIAANPTFDAALRQAGVTDSRLVIPGGRPVAANQCERQASGRTIAAEGAFALAEIDGWKAAIADDQNFLRTDA